MIRTKCCGHRLPSQAAVFRTSLVMIEGHLWQQRLADEVVALLQTDPSVLSIWFVGSLASSTATIDEWSDADIAVVVHDNALAGWNGAVDWLCPIGQVWATSVSEAPLRQVTRVVFYDGRRLDLVFFGHSRERPDWPGPRSGAARQYQAWPTAPFYPHRAVPVPPTGPTG